MIIVSIKTYSKTVHASGFWPNRGRWLMNHSIRQIYVALATYKNIPKSFSNFDTYILQKEMQIIIHINIQDHKYEVCGDPMQCIYEV